MVDGDVHPAGAGALDQRQRLTALSPGRCADDFVVRRLGGQPRFLPDANRFLHAANDLAGLIPYMRNVDASERAGNARESDHLLGGRVRPRYIEKARRKSECAV